MYRGTSFTLEDPILSPFFLKFKIASGLKEPSDRSPKIALSTAFVASAVACSNVFSASIFIKPLAEFSTLFIYLASVFIAAKPLASRETTPSYSLRI